MDKPKQHQITLKQGAVKYLRDMLAATGWAKTTADIILGGQLLVDVLPENIEPPVRHANPNEKPSTTFKEDTIRWSNDPLKEFVCSQKQYDACRKAIDYFVAQGAIPPSPSAAELLCAFGYSPE